MAQFVYIDETGSPGRGAAQQPYLTLAAVLVPEEKVRPLSTALRNVANYHLDDVPADFEFHGYQLWNGKRWWSGKKPPELITAYKAAIAILQDLELSVAHASIHKQRLHMRYNGAANENAYLLALQFLLEKVDKTAGQHKIVIADEAKEQQFRAIRMVADMQDWRGGEVPGSKLATVIDSLHFVQSNASPGVQMADLVAYVLQRYRTGEKHPDANAAMASLYGVVSDRTATWREPWPARPIARERFRA